MDTMKFCNFWKKKKLEKKKSPHVKSQVNRPLQYAIDFVTLTFDLHLLKMGLILG